MKAKDLIRELLYRATDTTSKGLFHNIPSEDYNPLEVQFGSKARIIEGELESPMTYMYDYSEETIAQSSVTIEDNCGAIVYLTKIED